MITTLISLLALLTLLAASRAVAAEKTLIDGVPDTVLFELIKSRAQGGDTDAQCDLGHLYALGKIDEPDARQRAAYWITKAAEQGSPRGLYLLSELHLLGMGVPADGAEALRLCRSAADMGYGEAQREMGRHCIAGKLTPTNLEEGIKWLKLAVESGDIPAMHMLALGYRSGEGTEKDEKKAVALFSKAASLDFPDSIFELGRCYAEGLGTPIDKNAAGKCFSRAASMGHIEALCALGYLYISDAENGDRRKEGMEYLTRAAEKGFAPAHLILGFTAMEEGDAATAFTHMKKAAEAGDPQAQYELGMMYISGRGTRPDPAKGLENINLAAEAGHTEAVQLLGQLKEAQKKQS